MLAHTFVSQSGDNSLMLSQTTSTLRQSSPLRRIVERLNKNLFSVLSSRASSILTHELESNDDDVDFLELDIIQSEVSESSLFKKRLYWELNKLFC